MLLGLRKKKMHGQVAVTTVTAYTVSGSIAFRPGASSKVIHVFYYITSLRFVFRSTVDTIKILESA